MREQKVSVIVPVYNVQSFLNECVDSIINQTYTNLEILLIDDGSNDLSSEICDDFAHKDSRIIVIHKKNEGVSVARNLGLELATGTHIAFVDSDDTVSPVFIDCLLSADADVAQCGFTMDKARLKQDTDCKYVRTGGKEALEKLQQDDSGTYTVLWNKLWKRQLFHNLRFPVGKINEEEFITWKVLWNVDVFAKTEVPLYFYRQREGSITHSKFSFSSLDKLEAIEERIAFYNQAGEQRLSAMTSATYCHVLRRILPDIIETIPDKQKQYRDRLLETYKASIVSDELSLKKKAALSLQMMSPNVYCHLKRVMKGTVTER